MRIQFKRTLFSILVIGGKRERGKEGGGGVSFFSTTLTAVLFGLEMLFCQSCVYFY